MKQLPHDVGPNELVHPDFSPRQGLIKVDFKKGQLQDERANGCFVTLARNSDLKGVLSSISSLEDKFNHRAHYDWVFLNDEDFTEEFKQQVSKATSGNALFGKVDPSDWKAPDDLDMERYKKAKELLEKQKVPYANLDSYRLMCRYESGPAFNHTLLQPYDWYWRVEPEVDFFCDIDFDPFKYMIENEKVYGFMAIPYEIRETIPSLWDTTKSFIKAEGLTEQIFGKDRTNALHLISEDEGQTYNTCHFWSNFEIASLQFYRSELYQKYFKYLDEQKGFFYERWGDAPVHTMAAALFLDKEQLHLFSAQFGYRHTVTQVCPRESDIIQKKNCRCDYNHESTFKTGLSCGKRYHDTMKLWYDSEWVTEW